VVLVAAAPSGGSVTPVEDEHPTAKRVTASSASTPRNADPLVKDFICGSRPYGGNSISIPKVI
jgi:hypothetical protein